MDTIILGVVMFTVVVLGLVAIILFARSKMVSTGDVKILINGEKNNHSTCWWKVTANLV